MQDSLLRPDVVSINGFAEMAKFSLPSMRQRRRFGLLPEPLQGGGCGQKLVWRRADAEAWVQANRPQKSN
jgi:hypothetical protein